MGPLKGHQLPANIPHLIHFHPWLLDQPPFPQAILSINQAVLKLGTGHVATFYFVTNATIICTYTRSMLNGSNVVMFYSTRTRVYPARDSLLYKYYTQ